MDLAKEMYRLKIKPLKIGGKDVYVRWDKDAKAKTIFSLGE